MKITSVFILFTAMVFSGCASQKYDLMMKEMQDSVNSMQGNVSKLQRTQSQDGEKMEELSSKVSILQQRLGDVSRDIDEIKLKAGKPPEEPVAGKEEIKSEEPKEEPPVAQPVEQKAEEPKEEPRMETEERHEEPVQKEEEVASPETLYKEGQELLDGGKQQEAVGAFESLIRHYPKSSLADNALYWIGEIHYSNKDYSSAAAEFRKVADDYPRENKTPDALLKLGITYQRMGEKEKAVGAFKELIDKYPKSDAAKKAKAKLK